MKVLVMAIFLACLSTGPAHGQDAQDALAFTLDCGAAAVEAGRTITVRVVIERGREGNEFSPQWTWSVTGGEIVSGDGSTELTVRAAELSTFAPGFNPKVYVEARREFRMPDPPRAYAANSCSVRIEEPLRAEKVEELRTDPGSCEQFLYAAGDYFSSLANEPSARGIIIIYADAKSPSAVERQVRRIRNYIGFRHRFDGSRLTVVRGPLQSDAKTEFWIVPLGAEDPIVLPADPAAAAVVTAETVDAARPYIYATDGEPGCDEFPYNIPAFAAMLTENPGYRCRIVINEASRAKFLEKEGRIRTELERNGLESRRIETVFERAAPNRPPRTELWVLPGPEP